MKKCASDIYQKIVNSKIGEPVSLKHTNGNDYNQTIVDMLENQGYKKGVAFDTEYNWREHQVYIKKLSAIKPYEEPKHNIKPGDIFYNSWGYEQTNIDFYQVVATTEKTISLRKIKCRTTDYNGYQMTGHKEAARDSFCGEIIKKTPYLFMGKWRINFEYGAGCQWDGEPMDYSRYA